MKGRTWRNRRAKTVRTSLRVKDFVLGEEYIELLRWAKNNGARFPKLHPASFTNTGRGIMAKKGLKAGEEIISLPESLLITCRTVKQGWLGSCMEGSGVTLTPRQKLCVFLIYERCRGEDSFWRYYISSLPQCFNTPACFTKTELSFLPESCRLKAEQQIHEVKTSYKKAKAFWSHLLKCTPRHQNLQECLAEAFTYKAFTWAWFAVNTRTVFMDHGKDPDSLEHDTYALAPVLDLLNHSSHAQVEAGFHEGTRCYRIQTLVGYKRGSQVFINYGPHDNQTLLVEYGFVLSDNVNSKVHIDKNQVLSLVKNSSCMLYSKKVGILERSNLSQDFYCTDEGLSWTLLAALRILSLNGTELHSWERVLNGSPFSISSESQVNDWVVTLLMDCLQARYQDSSSVVNEEVSYNIGMSQCLLDQEKKILTTVLDWYRNMSSISEIEKQ